LNAFSFREPSPGRPRTTPRSQARSSNGTPHAADPPADDGRAAGIDRWVGKPVRPTDLANAVETLLADTHTPT
jgi:hypothetical protein